MSTSTTKKAKLPLPRPRITPIQRVTIRPILRGPPRIVPPVPSSSQQLLGELASAGQAELCSDDLVGVPLEPETAATIAATESNYETIYLLKSKDLDIRNENKHLIDVFNLLVTQIQQQIKATLDAGERRKHGFRLSSIKKAIDVFEKWPGRITSGAQAQQVKGIGKKIGARIDEILRTGTLAELTEVQVVSDYTRRVNEIAQVTGIGPVHAKDFVDRWNLQGVDDLIARWQDSQNLDVKVGKNKLTHHMTVGLRWYYDILQKIPRAEIREIDAMLHEVAEAIDPCLRVKICGSYRREAPVSGDIDVLLTHPDMFTADEVSQNPRKFLPEFVESLIESGFVVDSLTDKGQTKYMGVCKLTPDSPGRRIDIRFVAYESWAPAQFYFTGSGHFNKIFRGIALQRGFTVNEYGIYRLTPKGEKGERIPSFSEGQIFAMVGVHYLTPKERELR